MFAHSSPRKVRALALVFGLGLLCFASGHAAQAQPAEPQGRQQERPRKVEPKPLGLDELYARLKDAEEPAEAKGVANLISRRLARSGSATADLLSERARVAMSQDDLPLAVELMDRATALEPGWSEGWNRRANLFFRLSDARSAITDLERALVIEPRHFEAWAGLGRMYLTIDDKKRAFDAFRRAEALYPSWDVVQEAIKKLKPDVEGRDL